MREERNVHCENGAQECGRWESGSRDNNPLINSRMNTRLWKQDRKNHRHRGNREELNRWFWGNGDELEDSTFKAQTERDRLSDGDEAELPKGDRSSLKEKDKKNGIGQGVGHTKGVGQITGAGQTYVHDSESNYDQNGQDRFLLQLLEMQLQSLSFSAFSRLVRQLLMQSGYSSVRSCGQGQDRKTWGEGSVDLMAFSHTDFSTSLTAIQIKMHRQPVPGRFVDELRGVMGRLRADGGLMVSIAPFSAWTRKVASWPDQRPVQLVDSVKLAEMLLEKRLGVRPVQQNHDPGVRYVFDGPFFAALEPNAKAEENNASESRTSHESTKNEERAMARSEELTRSEDKGTSMNGAPLNATS